MRYLRVKNFDEFQHYNKNRQQAGAPHWIKFYTGLLHDAEFLALPELTQRRLMMLWLLASQTKNKLPDDYAFLGQQISAKESIKKDMSLLIETGFLIPEEKHSRVVPENQSRADIGNQSRAEEKRVEEKRKEETPPLTPPHPGKFDGSTLNPEELAIAKKAKAETEERRRVMDSSGDEEWGSVGKIVKEVLGG